MQHYMVSYQTLVQILQVHYTKKQQNQKQNKTLIPNNALNTMNFHLSKCLHPHSLCPKLLQCSRKSGDITPLQWCVCPRLQTFS